ncbi:MAG: hypothetical protein QM765_23700 [Myxococcales bacterium]
MPTARFAWSFSQPMVLLTLVIWVAPVGAMLGLVLSQPRSAAQAATRPASPRAGAWGELEVAPLTLEPPPEFVSSAGLAARPVRWVLHGVPRERAPEWFSRAGLSAEQTARLESARWESLPDGIAVHPPDDLVFSLEPATRERLYAALASFPENRYQREPARFPGTRPAEWFDHSALGPKTVERISQLVYRRHETLLFSDIDLALSGIDSVAEREAFILTMARERSVMVRLKVPHGADVRALADYWALPGRSRDVVPLLEALAVQQAGGTVNVALLLPPFPRSTIYTFATAPLEPAKAPDCFATCLNFQKDVSREQVSWGLQPFQEILERDYDRPTGDPRLGDLFLLAAEDSAPVHCAVYVADDILFTKNGASTFHPWMLMRASDVAAMFVAEKPLQWKVMRKRDQ